jgi:hypothetical protein
MKFGQYIELFEDVPVGLKNKELWLDYLKEKYSKSKGMDKLYVSFVNVDKIGINPKSPYDTPIGVYTYPLEWVLEEEDVPFRGEIKPKKVKVLKRLSEKVLNDDLTEAELNHYKDILKKQYKIDSVDLLEWNNKARKKTPFGKLWNITRMLSLKLSKNKPEKSAKDMTPDELADALSGVNKTPAKNSAVIWNKLLRDLGFDYVQDNDFGIIHPSEPTQAVFLTPKAYKVIDEEFVDSEERFKHTHNQETKDLIEKIQKDGWSPKLINKIIEEKRYSLLKVFQLDGIERADDALSLSVWLSKNDGNKLFEKLLPYFLKNNKLENIDFYINVAIEFWLDDKKNYEPLLKLLSLKTDIKFDKEILENHITRLLTFLRNYITNDDLKTREAFIKYLEDHE